jgi:hypothetical protein
MLKKSVLLVLSLGAAAPVAAQGSRSPVCWLRPGPLARCNTWLVTEAAVEIPFANTKRQVSAGSTEKDFQERFTLSVGMMKNLPHERAAGIVLGHDVNRDIFRGPTRAEARFRQWRGTSAIDVSAGVSRKGLQTSTGSVDSPGLTAAIGGEWRYIGADVRMDLHQADGRTVAAGFIGARATSVAAPAAALAVFGAVAALILATGAGY